MTTFLRSSGSGSNAGRRGLSSGPIATLFLAVLLTMAALHIIRSLMLGAQYTYSITSIQNHYYTLIHGDDTTKQNHYYLLSLQNNSFFSTLPPSKRLSSSWSLSPPTAPSLDDVVSLPSKFSRSSRIYTQTNRKQIVQQRLMEDPRPFVAIVICTRSNSDWSHVNETSLQTLLIPSIERTVTKQEWKQYRIELFIGFDAGDRFWENRRHRDLLQSVPAATQTQPHLAINFMALKKKRLSQIPFNAACRAAYELGSDYIVRINDDTEFLTSQWITKGVEQLSKFRPSNLGVVGPRCDQGNTDILTHDMVHRLHLDIFGMEYYPDEFDNWWIDDWITHVYGENHTQRIYDWEVHHHTNKHGTRYRVDDRLRQHLTTTIKRGREQIMRYVNDHQPNDSLYISKFNISFQVLGSNEIPAAWGASMDQLYDS